MFMLRRVNKMQPSQSNWNFPDFPPVPLSKPELLKLTIVMKIEMYYLTRRQSCQFPPWSKKSNIFPRISRVVTFLAWRYNSRETAWFQTTELKNPWKNPWKPFVGCYCFREPIKTFFLDACQMIVKSCVLHLFPVPETGRSHIINILLASFFRSVL